MAFLPYFSKWLLWFKYKTKPSEILTRMWNTIWWGRWRKWHSFCPLIISAFWMGAKDNHLPDVILGVLARSALRLLVSHAARSGILRPSSCVSPLRFLQEVPHWHAGAAAQEVMISHRLKNKAACGITEQGPEGTAHFKDVNFRWTRDWGEVIMANLSIPFYSLESLFTCYVILIFLTTVFDVAILLFPYFWDKMPHREMLWIV